MLLMLTPFAFNDNSAILFFDSDVKRRFKDFKYRIEIFVVENGSDGAMV